MQAPTVKIKSADPAHGGYIVINETDFDPATHKRHIDPPPGLAPPPAPSEPPPLDPLAALPQNWRDLDAPELKARAAAVSGRSVENKKQAVDVIEAALAARQ